ncbi:MAG TPA: phytoene desaturase family protein [Candidatus Limnocylindria bacterium]|nr:phytoene desaturase family protein [Candidatus Limnocylindria bacterium]
MSRVVVVGAGMAGLACAARLAVKGHDVVVLEQAPTWGGKLGWYTRDGFSFDTGPSLLTLPAVYRDTFLKTGAALEDCVDLVGVDPVCHYRFADGTELDLPDADRRAVARAFDEALGIGAGDDWLRFLAHAGRIWQATRGPFLTSPLEGPIDLLRQSTRLRDLHTIAPWRTLDAMGRRYLRDPRLRQFLWRYATYTGSDPRRAPAALAVVPYVEQTFGAHYVRGGLRRLGEALYERCLERGVTFRFDTDVAEVLVERGRAVGVRLGDDERLSADHVVCNADAAEVYGRLVTDESGDPGRARLRKATPSLAGFVLLLALDGRTPGLRHHTVLFPEDYAAEFDAIFAKVPHPVDDPTVYIAAPDDPALRPDDDTEAWFVLVNAPRHDPAAARGRGVDWEEPGLAEDYADRVLAVMADRGLDVRDRVRWRVVRTPADLERDTRAPGGSIYGTSSNGARSAFLRAANRSPVPGLYLAGGSAHPGGGLPLVGLSAELVADLIGRA